jgi:hypothetical protein
MMKQRLVTRRMEKLIMMRMMETTPSMMVLRLMTSMPMM